MKLVRNRRRGFSLIELLVVIAIILVIVAIAIPKMDAALANAREMAAIGHVRTILTAQTQYASQYGKFAERLSQLGPPASGGTGPDGANLISGDLAGGRKSGFLFQLSVAGEGYAIQAVPAVFGGTGRRTFYSDQTMVIRQNWGGEPATAQSPEIP
ncbi:prepilin-type N-terminal cleavage/methylation domain-containing protein [Paludibaculum fermentans]|uniref:Prepilin-type N-terminal cleavage/methylation domain-containing protein n=1 Tax=Paludibaculum fermentans TaxID=1473598 RepID=A0A7S7NN09_PALFE|nr:prepilin-type N-terminal cleavage/methylation domain-containing protein [Paludibaculum fermentans]QOY86611.1 prepilin-type N-terminal cleavage/methylation domain-containing protein [Paludibaculum fermentans]